MKKLLFIVLGLTCSLGAMEQTGQTDAVINPFEKLYHNAVDTAILTRLNNDLKKATNELNDPNLNVCKNNILEQIRTVARYRMLVVGMQVSSIAGVIHGRSRGYVADLITIMAYPGILFKTRNGIGGNVFAEDELLDFLRSGIESRLSNENDQWKEEIFRGVFKDSCLECLLESAKLVESKAQLEPSLIANIHSETVRRKGIFEKKKNLLEASKLEALGQYLMELSSKLKK